jgi:hypothetical protein
MNDNPCLVCGEPILRSRKGQSRLYCSLACKRAAQQARDNATSATPEKANIPSLSSLAHARIGYSENSEKSEFSEAQKRNPMKAGEPHDAKVTQSDTPTRAGSNLQS